MPEYYKRGMPEHASSLGGLLLSLASRAFGDLEDHQSVSTSGRSLPHYLESRVHVDPLAELLDFAAFATESNDTGSFFLFFHCPVPPFWIRLRKSGLNAV